MQGALPVLQLLESHGYEAVFVGGCVRDTWIGRELKDVDIATSATPQQVMEVFPHTIPTGLKHGTVTVIQDGEAYEITTYRTESGYEQFRRPKEVAFVTSLEADLERRDFTINAMAMRPDGTIVDPFGGMQDMERRTLRCVGDSDARFQEDALRMVRAIRFAAEFGMSIASDTWRALIRHRTLLSYVAMERVGAEADKMMGGKNPLLAMRWMAASGLLAHTKRELPPRLLRADTLLNDASASDEVNVSDRSFCILNTVDALPEVDNRWSALCLACSLTDEETAELFHQLRYSLARMQHVSAVVRVHFRMRCKATEGEADGQLRLLWTSTLLSEGKQASLAWLGIMRVIPALLLARQEADSQDNGLPVELEARLDKLALWLGEMPVWSVKDLAVGGRDLLQVLGRPAGPWMSGLLNDLVRAVAERRIPNDRDQLLAYAASMNEAVRANRADKESP
nr:CCA tRNA nucleotidyltransferase [Paenibacillus oenotherae]